MRLRALDEVVDALYALAPGDFVAARNLAAKGLREEKRKPDADVVAKLVKPSATAALLNAAARRHSDLIAAVLESGRRLRDAQTAVLSGSAPASLLKDASEQRRLAVREVLRAAGVRGDDGARTLEAASVDDELGHQLRTGRLTGAVTDGVGFSGGRTNAADDRFAAGLRLVAEAAAPASESAERFDPTEPWPAPVTEKVAATAAGEQSAAAEPMADALRDGRTERERVGFERAADERRAALAAAGARVAVAAARVVVERARQDKAMEAAHVARAHADERGLAVGELREALARGEQEWDAASREADNADQNTSDAASAAAAAEASQADRERDLADLLNAASCPIDRF